MADPITAVASRNESHPFFGELLRSWRNRRRLSQLDLALHCEVSQRHLSFLESGRAQPSREMILRLCEALHVPLRDSNRLLHAAGFAPLFAQRALGDADMAVVRQALEMTLRHHEPFPALVVDSGWDLVMKNAAVERILRVFGDEDALWQRVDPSGHRNMMRLTFSSHGLQPLIRNWEFAAAFLLLRLQTEVESAPAHTYLRELFDELRSLPGVPARWSSALRQEPSAPVLILDLALGGARLRLFSMISVFGTAIDVTADELRIETFFPADAASAAFFGDGGKGAEDDHPFNPLREGW